jgi:hypothetical protein
MLQAMERYLDQRSAERINFKPSEVRAAKEAYAEAKRAQDIPSDLFEPFRVSALAMMEEQLPHYHASEFYLNACARPNGFMWRVVKLSRVILELCDRVMREVVQPFLEVSDTGEGLGLVPNYSAQCAAAFRADIVKLRSQVGMLRQMLNATGYIAARESRRIALREKRDAYHISVTHRDMNGKRNKRNM